MWIINSSFKSTYKSLVNGRPDSHFLTDSRLEPAATVSTMLTPLLLTNFVRCRMHGHSLTQHKKTMTYETIMHALICFSPSVHMLEHALIARGRMAEQDFPCKLTVLALKRSWLQKTLLTRVERLAKKLTLANKLTPRQEPVPDRRTAEIEHIAQKHSFYNQNSKCGVDKQHCLV